MRTNMATETRRDVFQAIADPTRRQIIHLISQQPMTLNTLAKNFDISRPAVSQQIKILTECGLVLVRQQGRERFCEARLAGLQDVSAWVEQYRRFWEARMDKLGELLNGLQSSRKNNEGKK